MNFNPPTTENDTEDILDMDYFRNNFSPPSSLKSESDYNANNKTKVKRRLKKIAKVKRKNVRVGSSNNSNTNSLYGESRSYWSGSSESLNGLVKCHWCQEMKMKYECLKCGNRKCRERFCGVCIKKKQGSGVVSKQIGKRWECFKCRKLCKCKQCKSGSGSERVVNSGEVLKQQQQQQYINNNSNCNSNIGVMNERYINMYQHNNNKVISHHHQHAISINNNNNNNRDEVCAMPKFVEINNKYIVYEIDGDNDNNGVDDGMGDNNKYAINTNNINNLLLNKTKCEMYYHQQQPTSSSSIPTCSICKHQSPTPNDLLYFETYNSFLCYLQCIFTLSPYEKLLNINIPFFSDNKQKFLSYLSYYLKYPYSFDDPYPHLTSPPSKTICKLCLLKHINAPNGYEKLTQDLYPSSSSFIYANPIEHFHPMYMNTPYTQQQLPLYIYDDYYNDALFYNHLNNFINSNYFSGDTLLMGFPIVLNNYTKIHFMQNNSALISGVTELVYLLFKIIQESKERLYSTRIDDLAKQFYIKNDLMQKKCESFRMVFDEYNKKINQIEETLNSVELCMKGKNVDMKEFETVKTEFIKEKEMFKENVSKFDKFCSDMNMMCFNVDYCISHIRNVIEVVKVYMAGRANENVNGGSSNNNNVESSNNNTNDIK